MIDWSKYSLRDCPIADFPHVDVHSPDIRINGSKFYESPVKQEFDKAISFVNMERTPIFLLSTEMVLGTGKSALLAHVYWKLVNSHETCLWVRATGYSPMRRILLKVADEMAGSKLIKNVKTRLESAGSLAKGIEKLSPNVPSHPSLKNWATRALERPDLEFATALSNVGRQTQAFNVVEAFSYVLDICKASTGRRVFVFLDQLEIYVMTNRAFQIATELNELIRAISGKAILVATLHNDARIVLETKCGAHVETFLKSSPMVHLRRLSTDDCIEIGAYWLQQFRTRDADKYYPFTKGALSEIAERMEHNVRDFLSAMRAALAYGANSEHPKIDERLLSSKMAEEIIFGPSIHLSRTGK